MMSPPVIPPPEIAPLRVARALSAGVPAFAPRLGHGIAEGLLAQARRRVRGELTESAVWIEQTAVRSLLDWGRELEVLTDAGTSDAPDPQNLDPQNLDPQAFEPGTFDPEDPPPLREGFTVSTTFVEAGRLELPPVDVAETVCLDDEDRVR